MTDWQSVPFIDYLNEVDRLLEETYGITTNDAGVEKAALCQECGDTPAECVQWISEKYGLAPLKDLNAY